MWEAFKKGDAFAGTDMAARCYESHPVLKIGKGKLYGGSASYPVVKDADVYVALQAGSTSGRISDPWEKQTVVEVQYAITDMNAPSNLSRWKKMVTWLCNQLHDGKTVHVGCIGGHGRSGTLLTAIVAEALKKTDAIQYVRKHYCKRAVESKAQVQFLMKHYGVSEVEPTKTSQPSSKMNGESWTKRTFSKPFLTEPEWVRDEPAKPKQRIPEGVSSRTKCYTPMASTPARSLWKRKKAV